MDGLDIGAAVGIGQRDGRRHLASQGRIRRLELIHFDNLLVRHFTEAAMIGIGAGGRFAGPTRILIGERNTISPPS